MQLLHTPSDLTGKNLIFFPQSLGLSQCFEWISEERHCWWSSPDADFNKPFIPFKISPGFYISVSVILLMCLRGAERYCTWIKRDQLDVTCFFISLFNAQHVSDVNTSILRSLGLICWVISWVVLLWFDVCWCYGVVWLGWCGIRMQAEALVLQPAPPQPNHNVTPTHIEPEQYNRWINVRNMLSNK